MVPGAVPGGAAGGALKKALFIVALLIVAFCVIPLPSTPEQRAPLREAKGIGPLRAGAARVRIELPEHPILAGYAGHHRARDATQPVYARAIVLEAGTARMVLASIDTLLVPPRFWNPDVCALVAAVAGAALAALLSDKATALLVAGIALLIILRHHANIRRLLAGTESRISLGKG